MLSLAWKKLLIVSAFVGASVMLSANVADARWGSSGGSWGSSGGSWGSSGGSWGSSGGSWGSSGGGVVVVAGGSWGSGGSSGGAWRSHRHHIPRRHFRAYHSSGSSGGSWGSHGSSGGSYGSYGSHGSSGGVYYSSPVHEAAPSDTPEVPVDPQARAQSGTVTIAINVPANAEVFINGTATNSTGEERVYVSKGLDPGKRYRYTIRAEIERDGQKVVQEESVVLTSGSRSQLALNFDAASESVAEKPNADNPRTTLKVEVPADAKVSVLGVESHQSGSVRYFHTDLLAPGQTWDGYTVKAVVVREGRPIEMEKRVTLLGGETQQLAFDFEAAELAGRISQSTR